MSVIRVGLEIFTQFEYIGKGGMSLEEVTE